MSGRAAAHGAGSGQLAAGELAAVGVHLPGTRADAVGFAALGGLAAAVVALVLLAAGTVLLGGSVVASVNAVGAWAVRWLQFAAPDALGHAYADATSGGLATIAVAGTVGGAVFGGCLERARGQSAAAWGVLTGAVAWIALRYAVSPALDPLLVRTVDWRLLLPACLAYGLALGSWVEVGRQAV